MLAGRQETEDGIVGSYKRADLQQPSNVTVGKVADVVRVSWIVIELSRVSRWIVNHASKNR